MKHSTVIYTFRHIIITLTLLIAGVGVLQASGDDIVSPIRRMPELLNILKSAPDNISALSEAADIYLEMSDYDGCKRMATRLENVAYRYPDSIRALFQSKLLKGRMSIRLGRGEDAVNYLSQAVTIAEINLMKRELIVSRNYLAYSHINFFEDYMQGIDLYNQALDEARALGNPSLTARTLYNLADAYLWRNDFSGVRFAEEALSNANETGDRRVMAECTLQVAMFNVYNPNRYEYVLEMLDRVRALRGNDTTPSDAEIALVESLALRTIKDYASSLRVLETALADSASMTGLMKVKLLMSYSMTLVKSERTAEAIKALDSALGVAREIHFGNMMLHLLSGLAYLHDEAGNYKEAYYCQQAYSRHLDSLYIVDHTSKLIELEAKNKTLVGSMMLERNKAEIATRDKRIWILVSLIIACVVAATVLSVAYRRQRRMYRTIVGREEEARARERLLRAALEEAREKAEADSGGERATTRSLAEDKVDMLMVRFNELMTERRAYADLSISIKSVAEELETNRTYLSQAINRAFGKSFPQVLAEYRVRAAIELMDDPELPLKAIAAEVGFSSLSTFYNSFRDITGMPPSKYRENRVKE